MDLYSLPRRLAEIVDPLLPDRFRVAPRRIHFPLELTISLVGQHRDGYEVQLIVVNRSAVPLILPLFDVDKFRYVRDGVDAPWQREAFESTMGGCHSLSPSASLREVFRIYETRFLPSTDVYEPTPFGFVHLPEVCSIPLTDGEYELSYRLRVDEAYHDPDSHWQLRHLEFNARKVGAKVWLGKVESNRLVVHWPPRP